jgi:3-isopropylmalate/(R)-2-methylmalate dehydratase small subunit
MAGINIVEGTATPLDQANIDTDQIIPKQFLTGVTRAGYGVNLFHDWRYLNGDKNQVDASFPLNNPEYAGSKILLTRENFGCGSSREHAPGALADFGFSCIIATSYADIFYGNSINNQLLVVTLSNKELDQLFAKVTENPKVTISVNLTAQTVKCEGLEFSFDIASHHKTNLLKGLDAIGQTLVLDEEISKFEKQRQVWL